MYSDLKKDNGIKTRILAIPLVALLLTSLVLATINFGGPFNSAIAAAKSYDKHSVERFEISPLSEETSTNYSPELAVEHAEKERSVSGPASDVNSLPMSVENGGQVRSTGTEGNSTTTIPTTAFPPIKGRLTTTAPPETISPSVIDQVSGGDVTSQAALSSLSARPTNNLVNTISFYDVVFLTSTSGAIKTIQVTFPAGTVIPSGGFFNEAEGIGPGTASKSGQTITYTVTNAVNVPAGSKIRLEFANINNPINPSASYKVTVTTKNAANTIIDGPTQSTAYTVKQIGANVIANNAITNPKIANDAVTLPKIAPNTVVTGASGFQFVTSPLVDVQPGDDNFATAQCPPNHVITGGGFGASDGTNGELVYDASFAVFPQGQPPSWQVHAWNNGGDTVHQMQAIAECLAIIPNP